MAKKLQGPKEMRVEIKKEFLSPLTGRLTIVGKEINVPVNRFWLRRLNDEDCKKVKKSVKPKSSKGIK